MSSLGLAALARSDTPEDTRKPFYIYLDEFQSFATLALAGIPIELPEYGVGLVLAYQYLDQLAPEIRTSILGKLALVVFRVGGGNASKLARELSATLNAEELTYPPNRCFWVGPLVQRFAISPFVGETLGL